MRSYLDAPFVPSCQGLGIVGFIWSIKGTCCWRVGLFLIERTIEVLFSVLQPIPEKMRLEMVN